MALKLDSLESLCELIVDCPHSTPRWTDEGVIVLRNQNIRNGVLDLSSPSYTNETDYQKRIKRAIPQTGDIVFTREAPMGEVCLIPEGLKCCLGQRQVLLRPKKGISGEYLFWALQSPYVQHQISWNEGTGTTVSNVRIPVLKALKIPRHPEDEFEVARYISTIARKIQLNRQTNQTLEQMAQALFKSWFVDFDPVIDNALAAGKLIPDALQARAQRRQQQLAKPDHKPLPEEFRQHFPCEFEQTEALGWVPKGWKEQSVNKLVEINPRVKLPKGTVAKFVDMKALPTNGYSISNIIQKAYSGGAKFQEGDVLLARITPCLENGKTGIVDFLAENEVGFGSTEFIVMRRKGAIDTSFIACLSRDENFRAHCIQSMVGSSGRQRIQNACFDTYKLAMPTSDKLLSLFERLTSTHFLKMTKNKVAIETLVELRDTLLPKLISGELRIPDVQKEVSDAVA